MIHKKEAASFETASFFVGMTRFELATPRPPDVCATGLRYIPKMMPLFNRVANVTAFYKIQLILHKILQPPHEYITQAGKNC